MRNAGVIMIVKHHGHSVSLKVTRVLREQANTAVEVGTWVVILTEQKCLHVPTYTTRIYLEGRWKISCLSPRANLTLVFSTWWSMCKNTKNSWAYHINLILSVMKWRRQLQCLGEICGEVQVKVQPQHGTCICIYHNPVYWGKANQSQVCTTLPP